jgi:hypothetical protein
MKRQRGGARKAEGRGDAPLAKEQDQEEGEEVEKQAPSRHDAETTRGSGFTGGVVHDAGECMTSFRGRQAGRPGCRRCGIVPRPGSASGLASGGAAPLDGRMVRLFGYPLVALALFAMAGGHWAVLQAVAWAGMVSERVEQKTTLRQAVAETFDGDHPCAMCREIALKKNTDAQKPSPLALTVKMAKKAEAVSNAAWTLPLLSVSPGLVWRAGAEVGPVRREAPSPRPPRGFLSFAA